MTPSTATSAVTPSSVHPSVRVLLPPIQHPRRPATLLCLVSVVLFYHHPVLLLSCSTLLSFVSLLSQVRLCSMTIPSRFSLYRAPFLRLEHTVLEHAASPSITSDFGFVMFSRCPTPPLFHFAFEVHCLSCVLFLHSYPAQIFLFCFSCTASMRPSCSSRGVMNI